MSKEVSKISDSGSNETLSSLTNETSSSLWEEEKLLDLHKGDHIIRWTWIGMYPIQVHGIVLSSNPDCVTIVDCGLTAVPPRTIQDDELSEGDSFDKNDYEKVQSAVKKVSQKRQRLNIFSLCTDDPELRKWHKVRYQPTLNQIEDALSSKESEADLSTCLSKDEKSTISDDKVRKESTRNYGEKCDNEQKCRIQKKKFSFWGTNGDRGDHKKKNIFLPQSDPVPIVLERIRFLLHQKESNDILPSHHVFYANSECIAVWCKTGTFSTLQASIFLSSSAVGQVKSISMLGAYLAGDTVTAATVGAGLLATQPWILPVYACYSLVAIGTPVAFFLRCRHKWRKATQILNDSFWFCAKPHVYVCAIQHWSHLSTDESQ